MRSFVTSLVISFLGMSCTIKSMDEMAQSPVIESVQQQFAPDKRVAIFEANLGHVNGKMVLKGKTSLPKAKEALLSKLQEKHPKLMDSLELLPSKELGDKNWGIVNLSVANLRTYPKHSAEMATQALLGSIVRVLEQDGEWYRVQTPDNYIAWVDHSGIVTVNEQEKNDWLKAHKLIWLRTFGNAHEYPDAHSQTISDLATGNLVLYSGDTANFYRVTYPDGRTAYWDAKHCIDYDQWLDSIQPSGTSIVEQAKRFLGFPYQWGGTSSKSFDCSGFSKTVYQLCGLVLQRDASQQVLTGQEIEGSENLENLLPGDLLFFGYKPTAKNPKTKVTHVGIYMGNQEFIHASGKVKINSFDPNSPIYNAHRHGMYLKAKRILTSVDSNNVVALKSHPFYMLQK